MEKGRSCERVNLGGGEGVRDLEKDPYILLTYSS